MSIYHIPASLFSILFRGHSIIQSSGHFLPDSGRWRWESSFSKYTTDLEVLKSERNCYRTQHKNATVSKLHKTFCEEHCIHQKFTAYKKELKKAAKKALKKWLTASNVQADSIERQGITGYEWGGLLLKKLVAITCIFNRLC